MDEAYVLHSQDMQDVMPTRAQQGILGTDHGQGEAMDMAHGVLIMVIIMVSILLL